MIVRVETPDGDKGQVCGFAIRPWAEDLDEQYLVLVAIEGKSGDGKLEVYAHDDLVVKVVEPEYGE